MVEERLDVNGQDLIELYENDDDLIREQRQIMRDLGIDPDEGLEMERQISEDIPARSGGSAGS